MAPILWALGGALAVHLIQRHKTTASVTPPAAPGQMTPARAAVHGDLMANCINPAKLTKAANLFGAEGLPHHAEALLRKAAMIHEMMHGAKALVERCRAGDQHAMAIVKGIGEQARQGQRRAQISKFLIEEYTKQNPAKAAA